MEMAFRVLGFFTGSNGRDGEPKRKSLKEIAVDSLIIGAIAFFSTWTGSLDISNLLVSLKAFGLSFFLQFAYERGVKKYA